MGSNPLHQTLLLLYISLEASALAKNGGMECVSSNSPTQHRPCREGNPAASGQNGRCGLLSRSESPPFCECTYHWPFLLPLAGAMPRGSKVIHLHLSLFISLYSTFDKICKNHMELSFRTLKLAANYEQMLWSSSTIRNGGWVPEVWGAEPRRVFRWGTIWRESQTSL